MILRLLMYCIALGIFLALESSVNAALLFQDNFDDSVMDGWQVIRNFQWHNQSLPCYLNDLPVSWQIVLQRLGISIDGPGCYTEIIAQHFSLPQDQGYAFEFDLTMPQSANMDRNYILKFVDFNNAYGVKILGNQIFMTKVAEAQVWTLFDAVATYPFEADTTYHIRNEMRSDHRIKIYINNELVIDAEDPPPYFAGGTVGFAASVGAIPNSEVWFDNVTVQTLPDARNITLNVPYYSQSDPAWKQERYDRADIWVASEKDTIERWGCALTSAVMVLRYHGIDEIAPGILISPSTLNAWLLNQPDGYIGQGFVNWIAITRLSDQFSMRHPETPSLEYSYTTLSYEQAGEQLRANQPFILEEPRHFVVVKGLEYENSSLEINDPNNEARAETPIVANTLSTRTFSPSFTDLSYILISHEPGITLHAFDSDGNAFQTFYETIADDVEDNAVHAQVFHQLAKPSDGEYFFTIESVAKDATNITVYFYDESANVQQATLSSEPGTYIMRYAKSGISTARKLHDPFIEQLMMEYKDGNIDTANVYYTLLNIASYREMNHAGEDERYQAYLGTLLQQVIASLNSGAYERLEQSL